MYNQDQVTRTLAGVSVLLPCYVPGDHYTPDQACDKLEHANFWLQGAICVAQMVGNSQMERLLQDCRRQVNAVWETLAFDIAASEEYDKDAFADAEAFAY